MDTVDEIVGYEEPGDDVDRLAYQVIGAAIEVHRELGPGHLESVYLNAMAIELQLRGLPISCEHAYDVYYKGQHVGRGRMDLLVGNLLVVELKATDELAGIHTAQLISYLKANKLRLGVLINFNVRRLKDGVRRVAYTPR